MNAFGKAKGSQKWGLVQKTKFVNKQAYFYSVCPNLPRYHWQYLSNCDGYFRGNLSINRM